MSRMHGGWNEDDLRKVLGGDTETGYVQRMEEFAMGGGGETSTAPPETPGTPVREQPPPPPPEPTVRRVRATPKKLKTLLSAIPKKILEKAGLQLDQDDNEAMDEAGEFLGEIFGIDFEIDQKKLTVHSRLAAIAWVVGVTLLVYVKHTFKETFDKIFAMAKAEQEKDKAA